MNYDEAVRFVCAVKTRHSPAKESLKLERITRLLELLGNPQEEYGIIRVVGTAGKGSVAGIAASVLRAHGHCVGLHTSPHLQVINERMQVEGKFASAQEFVELAETIAPLCRQVNEELGLGSPTFFEATLAMALEFFKRKKAGFAVVEAGIGGKFDGTNALRQKALVLTNVFLDHTDVLGNSVEEIALDKAGAVKENAPTVTGASGVALKIIEDDCLQKNSLLFRDGKEILVENIECSLEKTVFDFSFAGKKFAALETPLVGSYQATNAALAIAAVGNCTQIFEGKIRVGLRDVFVPARFERVGRVVLDGAHNPAKAAALAGSLSLCGKKACLVMGITRRKDAKEMLRELLPVAEEFVFVPISGFGCYQPEELQETLREIDATKKSCVMKSVGEAIGYAKKFEVACVTGSFYLVGEARQLFLSNEQALLQQSLKL